MGKMFSQRWIIFVHHHGARQSSHQFLGQLTACVFAMQFLIVTVTRDISHMGQLIKQSFPFLIATDGIGTREGHGTKLWCIWPRNPTYDFITPSNLGHENISKETSGFAKVLTGVCLEA